MKFQDNFDFSHHFENLINYVNFRNVKNVLGLILLYEHLIMRTIEETTKKLFKKCIKFSPKITAQNDLSLQQMIERVPYDIILRHTFIIKRNAYSWDYNNLFVHFQEFLILFC